MAALWVQLRIMEFIHRKLCLDVYKRQVYLRERKPDQLRQAMHYFGIILFFTLGAGAGGVLTKYYGLHMIWLSCLLLLSVCLLMSAEE